MTIAQPSPPIRRGGPPRPLPDLRPRLALRVGVTGHRPDGLAGTPADLIGSSVAAILELVHRNATCVEPTACRYRSELPILTLLSGMADGADSIAAQVAGMNPAWRVHAVLPFPRPDSGDAGAQGALLEQADAITVLDGEAGQFHAYEPLAMVLVAQSDLLIAVWDGERANGPGGTETVVQRARREGVPIIRIDPRNPSAPWLEELREEDEGRASALARLDQTISDLLDGPPEEELAEEFLVGAIPRTPRSRLFERIVRLGAERPLDTGQHESDDPGVNCAANWSGAWSSLPLVVVEALVARFGKPHGWADAGAIWYGASFRQSFTAIFLLTVLAVFAAGLGMVRVEILGYAPEVVEVVLLLTILHFVRRGRQIRSQDRWVQYRSLAERLRHMAVLWPLGRTTPLVRVPGAGRPEFATTRTKEGWVAWYLRATAREAGLITGRLDHAHTASVRDWLLEAELLPQQEFHQATALRSSRVHQPLERWAERFVVLAVILSFARLTGVIGFITVDILNLPVARSLAIDLFMEPFLHAAAVTLPALAAGIHGFLGTADFEGTVLRSGAIAPQLGRIADRLRHAGPVNLTEVGEIATEMTRLMEGELGVWRTGTESRRLQP